MDSQEFMQNDIKFMKAAIKQAALAASHGEVPIGAVIVRDGQVIARGYNKRQKTRTALMHAEVVAIERACKNLGDWRLSDCDIYVTLEPCCMCVGLIINSRIRNVYFGAPEPKSGCCGSVVNLFDTVNMNQTTRVFGGILADECSSLISDFFKKCRK
ncbi:MAG: nucleoside deaminase [Clostridia bacterium]|nr:nucleoside deaminase [Clostridia bacterium]